MKLLYLVPLCFLLSCAPQPEFIQTYKVQPVKSLPENGGSFFYESDSIKVVYDFYGEGGVMCFIVFNKLDVPLYIDWKKSSFVRNGDKHDYWADETISRGSVASTHETNKYKYNTFISPYYTSIAQSYSLNESVSRKPERVTIIPPSAKIHKHKFKITYSPYSFSKPFTDSVIYYLVPRSGKLTLTRDEKVSYKRFAKSNSPLLFSSFLALSYKEDFSNEFYVNNQFFVSEIIETAFTYKVKSSYNSHKYTYPYAKPYRFQVHVPFKQSAFYNKVMCEHLYESGKRCGIKKKAGYDYCHTHRNSHR